MHNAPHFAETAFNATINYRIKTRQRLYVLHIGICIFVEDHPWIENPFRIEQIFYVLHQLVGIVTPFLPDERCHVASRTVFSLERTVVFFRDKFNHIAHHPVILRNRRRSVKALVQDEVPVAVEGVTVDHRVRIVVGYEKLLQFICGIRQFFDGDCDIFNQACGANLTSSAYSRKDSAAHRPVAGYGAGIGSEFRRGGKLER